jgi:DNA-binding SARP family transcriptional activator
MLARATQLDPKDDRARNNFVLAAMRSGRAGQAERVLAALDSSERESVAAFVARWVP